MGTGTNCSYTNSTSGVYIHLLCSTPTCCDTLTHSCTAAACSPASSEEVPVNTYLFWVILAGAAIFTVLTLVVSYAICRYRRPGCAEAGAARDRFLEENIVAATLNRWPGGGNNNNHHHNHTNTTTTSSSSPSSPSPPVSTSTPSISSSPDPLLLVHRPLNKAKPGRSMIPVKKPTAFSINKAFILGAEAFAHKPISVQGQGEPELSARRGGAGHRPRAGLLDVSVSGAASPRMVQLGGLATPRIPHLRSKGRTESKQTILSSSDSDSLTTVDS
ncbi:hypothetical protein ACOMHN_022289 [Nucella lapillus]